MVMFSNVVVASIKGSKVPLIQKDLEVEFLSHIGDKREVYVIVGCAPGGQNFVGRVCEFCASI